MTVAKTKYESPLREEQKAETRRRIVAAAERLMQVADLGEMTFSAISREAGVQERTVYRHFATKGDLLDALWDALDPRIGTGSFPNSEADLVEAPRRVFAAFDDNENLMRAFWSTPQGREFRLRVNDKRKAAIRKAVSEAVKGLPASEARWITAAAQLLYSGAAWQTMKDYWGFTGEEAGKASSFLLQLIFDAARERAHDKHGSRS